MFDVERPATLEEALRWFHEAKTMTPTNTVYMLVGNKLDQQRDEQDVQPAVSAEQGRALAESMGADYMECSAKTGYNVDHLFQHVDRACRQRYVAPVVLTLPPDTSRQHHGGVYPWPCVIL